MSLILTTSIAIRIAALAWSLVLLSRVRDLRMAFLSAMLALMALRQILTVAPSAVPWRGFAFSPEEHFAELPGLVVSVLAFLAVIFLERMLVAWRRDAEALRGRERERHQAQKLEALGTLAGGIAHDFNNLLTAVMGHASLAARRLERDAPAREDIAAIEHAARQASDLTRRILTFARQGPIEAVPVELNALIRDVLPTLVRLLGERVVLDADLCAAPVVVAADPTQLQLLLVNLVVNARDAMPEGGTIEIATTPRPAAEGAPTVVLSVRDDGVGMTEEVQQQIFEPFFTTKEVGKGTGLGLSTVYGIVRASGGQVRCESRAGSGTVFHVTLPLSERPVPPPTAVARAEAPGRTGTILLVEDEAAVRGLLERALGDAGHRLVTASDGREALELASTLDGPIDLLVTDVVMPGLGGWEVARRLRERLPALPVIVMSGYAERAAADEPLAPPLVFLSKPMSPDEIVLAVARLLA